MTDAPGGTARSTDLVRLEVNLNQPTAEALRAYMAAHQVSATEAIRRAISILKYVDDEQRAGRVIQSVQPARPRTVRQLQLPD